MAKPLIVLAALIAAFVVALGAASAAPAETAGWSTSAKPVTDTSNQFSSNDVEGIGTNAVFSCNYFSRSPYYVIDFTCNVTKGVIQLYVNCSDGRQILSGIVRAVGTYNPGPSAARPRSWSTSVPTSSPEPALSAECPVVRDRGALGGTRSSAQR
ncbi:hypothetical protein [Lentzea sp.]|uniref:hypothetical protein n=1 Tax=Lentzea sp. TaxID=56099 RepID=UPI002BD2D56D|nr:hypothetical protein [Lentzea sp.]HUQ59353.1 hypothetical protein [Lentzea sp.]